MEVYFAGSIRGAAPDDDRYRRIVEFLGARGTVLTEHVAEEPPESDLKDSTIHDRDLEWLTEADGLVAEVTAPRLGVGYEIGRATAWGMPIVCLYDVTSDRPLSAMVRGNDAVELVEYEAIEEGLGALGRVLDTVSEG